MIFYLKGIFFTFGQKYSIAPFLFSSKRHPYLFHFGFASGSEQHTLWKSEQNIHSRPRWMHKLRHWFYRISIPSARQNSEASRYSWQHLLLLQQELLSPQFDPLNCHNWPQSHHCCRSRPYQVFTELGSFSSWGWRSPIQWASCCCQEKHPLASRSETHCRTFHTSCFACWY